MALRPLRMRRFVAGVLAAAGIIACLSGCTGSCNAGSMPYPPALIVDASAWFTAHPDTLVRACLNTTCTTITGAQATAVKGLLTISQNATRFGARGNARVTVFRGSTEVEDVNRTVTMKQNRCVAWTCGCLAMGSTGRLRLDSSGTVHGY